MNLGPMWSYEVESEHVSFTNDSSLSLDIKHCKKRFEMTRMW